MNFYNFNSNGYLLRNDPINNSPIFRGIGHRSGSLLHRAPSRGLISD